jgi:hypothetical protein
MYYCVYPTQTARFGTALVPEIGKSYVYSFGNSFSSTCCALGLILASLPHFLTKFSFCFSSPLALIQCLLMFVLLLLFLGCSEAETK